MGQFSWCFANKNNEENLLEGNSAVVCCPDGSFIYETEYDGYGHFGGHDIYELVVDWNRKDLWKYISHSHNNRVIWKRNDILIALAAMESDENAQSVANKLYDFDMINEGQVNDNFDMRNNWKRIIGIHIACYDEDNAKLKYPIKITTEECNYNQLPASKGDPNQGWYPLNRNTEY